MSVNGALFDGAQLIRQTSQYLRETASGRAARDVSPSGAGMALLCVTTTDGNYPDPAGSPNVVFAVLPQELDADDSEGATSSASTDGQQKLYALNVGNAVPPQGAQILCHYLGGRLIFRFDGSGDTSGGA